MHRWTSVEPLSDEHALDDFTCGDDVMDAWVYESARRAHRQGSAAVTVCTNPDDGVVGFFALANHEVRRTDLSRGDAGGLQTIPATLLARIALHEQLRHTGLGTHLLVEALRVALTGSTLVGSRLIVLDAKNEKLASWYEERSFKRMKTNPLKLSMNMTTARRVIEALSGIE